MVPGLRAGSGLAIYASHVGLLFWLLGKSNSEQRQYSRFDAEFCRKQSQRLGGVDDDGDDDDDDLNKWKG
jgi:hypothetical protein